MSLLTPDEDCVSKALVFLIVLYVSWYRSVHFSRAVLSLLAEFRGRCRKVRLGVCPEPCLVQMYEKDR